MDAQRVAAFQHEVMKRIELRARILGRLQTATRLLDEQGEHQKPDLIVSHQELHDRISSIDDDLHQHLTELESEAETDAELAVLAMLRTMVRTAQGLTDVGQPVTDQGGA